MTPAQIEDMYKAYLAEEKHDMMKRAWEISSLANVMTRLHAPKSKHTFKPKDFYDPDEQIKADQDSQQAVKKSDRKKYISLKEKFGSTIE